MVRAAVPRPLDAPEGASILIVDDDPGIGSLLAEYLGKAGLRAEVAGDGEAMWRALEARRFDAVVLDLMLPGDDGLQLCRQLRSSSTLPVIMLTARGRPDDRIAGLETGADDYLAKPFDPRELLARLRAVLRRTGTNADPLPQQLRFSGFCLDTRRRELRDARGEVVALGSSDYLLLLQLLRYPDQVLERDHLAEQVYGRDRLPTDRAIDVCVSRVRQLLQADPHAPQLIRTVRHRGYLLVGPVHSDG